MFQRHAIVRGPWAWAFGLVLLSLSLVGAPPATAAETFSVPPGGLVDQNGNPYDGTHKAGLFRVVFFGFTNCPDICPTTLWELRAALETLAASVRETVQPVFVSVDPLRDSPDVLKGYLEPISPTFVGVSGTVEAIDAFAWKNGIYVLRNNGSSNVSYTVDHTSSLLLVDPSDVVVERIPYGMTIADLAERLNKAVRLNRR